MNIPSNPSINYIAITLFLIGLFLFISGLNIIKIEKITVSHGFKTWIIGLTLMAAGIFLGFPIINGAYNGNGSNKEKTVNTNDLVTLDSSLKVKEENLTPVQTKIINNKIIYKKLINKKNNLENIGNKKPIDCTHVDSGWYCQGCADVNDHSICQSKSGDCGSCGTNACLHSPKYSDSLNKTCPSLINHQKEKTPIVVETKKLKTNIIDKKANRENVIHKNILENKKPIDCTHVDSGWYCQGCADVNDHNICQSKSGDCGSCGTNACLHSPKYSDSLNRTCSSLK